MQASISLVDGEAVSLLAPSAPPMLPPPLAPPDTLPSSKLLLGMGLVCLSCFLNSAALIFMKASADCEGHLKLWRRWRWGCGFSCMIVAVPVQVLDGLRTRYVP